MPSQTCFLCTRIVSVFRPDFGLRLPENAHFPDNGVKPQNRAPRHPIFSTPQTALSMYLDEIRRTYRVVNDALSSHRFVVDGQSPPTDQRYA